MLASATIHKICLEWSNKNAYSEIVIHGCTKEKGYHEDKIDWTTIGLIQEQLKIPVTAHGEIFSREADERCIQQRGGRDLMLGRGILQHPNLANMIRFHESPLSWSRILEYNTAYTDITRKKIYRLC